MNSYICQFCNKSYQSDGNRKPMSFRRDGSIYHTYDSKIFCSKKCCLENRNERLKQTLKNNPEIVKELQKKRLQTLKNNPEILKQMSEKIKQNLRNNPEIVKQRTEKYKQTLKNYPEIRKQISKSLKQTYKNNPEIRRRAGETHKQTLKNNPEINKRRSETHKQTLKNNPEILKRQAETHKQTLKNNPEILKRRNETRKQTYKNHPELLEIKKQKLNSDEVRNKVISTKRKNNTFNTSKQEEQLHLLLEAEYSDTIRQYKDSRYPFCCDFYIPSKDLFIELQLSWTHGSKSFKENDVECQTQLNSWRQKSLTSKFYKNAIETWTIRDAKKRQIAEQNNLNYIEVFSSDFKELYDAGIFV